MIIINNSYKQSMHISYIKPLLSYGRFILEEERKRKIVQGQLPRIAFDKLLFQRSSLQPSIQKNLILTDIQNKTPLFSLGFPYASFGIMPRSIPAQKGDEEDEKICVSQEAISNANDFIERSILTKQYNANPEIEDRISVGTLKSLNNAFIVNVFDGHGGYILAEYCSENIVEVLDKIIFKKLSSNPKKQNISDLITEALKQAYQALQDQFYENIYLEKINLHAKDNKMKDRNVGSCGISVLLYEKQIYVANCGDSQAIMISGNKDQKNNHEFLKLNERLSVNNPHQRNRLLTQFTDDDIIVEQSKGVYYLKGRLQPTKSLGDFYLKKKQLWKGKNKFNGPYLNCIPQVNVYDLRQNNKKIIVASDGIWDFIDKWALTKLSANHTQKSQQTMQNIIVRQTLKKIAKMHNKNLVDIMNLPAEDKRKYHDDISVVVIQLEDYHRLINQCGPLQKNQTRQQTQQKQQYTKDNDFDHIENPLQNEDLEVLQKDWEQGWLQQKQNE